MPTLLARVQSILEFIHQRPLTPQLVTFLTQNFCPNGETCGVTVSYLRDDGTLICEVAQGFTNNEKLIGLASTISSDRPGAEALVKLRTLVLTRADAIGRFKDFVSQEFMDGFHSAVIMPIGLRTIYGFALQVDATKIDGFVEYSECLRSLLLFHEETSYGSRSANAMSSTRHAPRELTDRQKIVLAKMRAGMTNISISLEMGFSESLIRQETVIIYRKLGIAGRKELDRVDPNLI